MNSCCAFCYVTNVKLFRCSRCKKRTFCSKNCQRKYWKEHSHRFYCGKVGELGHDFKIKKIDGEDEKGLGMVATRNFQKNEIIMVERPLLKLPQPYLPSDRFHLSVKALSESELKAFEALVPNEGTHLLKYHQNSISCGDVTEMPDSAIFTLMSRVNHDCLGNSDHVHEDNRAMMILVANTDINTGEEITFSYKFGSTLERRSCLQKDHNFDCQCTICKGPLELQESFDRIGVLDKEILYHAQNARVDKALKCGKALISLYDQFHQSSFRYQRTYYDLFQCAITTRRTFKDGVFSSRKHMSIALPFLATRKMNKSKR